ncbi:MAG: hypothetical protein M1486_05250 [Gammaproteobacteria bacterium]|nr:hypothetical protein [Gammaproteobacteria bacterium]
MFRHIFNAFTEEEIKKGISQNIKETSNIKWKGVKTPNSKLKKVQLGLNSFTFFSDDSDAGDKARASLLPYACSPHHIYGHRTDLFHDIWHHLDKTDFDTSHTHIIKDSLDLFTPDDLNCFLENVKKVEKITQKCLDGKTDCFLTQQDLEKIQQAYQHFYNENVEPRKQYIKQLSEARAQFVYDTFTQALNITIHSFLKTILQDYLRLYLIGEGYSPKKIDAVMMAMDVTIKLALSFSILSIGFEVVIEKIIKPALSNLKILPPDVIDTLCGALKIASFVKDPFSMLQIGLAGSGTLYGKYTASRIIAFLPRIKKLKPEEQQPQEIKNEIVSNHPTLRLRK